MGKEVGFMPSSTLTNKGQTTIPKEVRAHLGLEPGDRIEYVIGSNGEVVLQAATLDLMELAGALSRPGNRPVSIEQMNQTVRRRAAGGR
jgi:antitoxin PrlF